MQEKVVKRYWPIFVIPTLGAFVIGFIVPFIQGLYLSFCSFFTIDKTTWVGLENYKRVFGLDPDFVDPSPLSDSLWFTVAFAVISIILINV